MANNLSRLENHEHVKEREKINEIFPDEQFFAVTHDPFPWYAGYLNFIASGVLHPNMPYEVKKRFLHNMNLYFWDEPFLYRKYVNQLIRRYIFGKKVE